MERQAAFWEYARLPAAIILSLVAPLFYLHLAFASKAVLWDTQICSVFEMFFMNYISANYTTATIDCLAIAKNTS